MAPSQKLPPTRRDTARLTQRYFPTFILMLLVFGLINVLAQTGSFYMLQLCDRALTSASSRKLAALSALAIGLYLLWHAAFGPGGRL